MSKDTGGPAFPFEGGDNNGVQPSYGMTLRDYFAAKAVQGFCAAPDMNRTSLDSVVEQAFEIADAMLAARVKP